MAGDSGGDRDGDDMIKDDGPRWRFKCPDEKDSDSRHAI